MSPLRSALTLAMLAVSSLVVAGQAPQTSTPVAKLKSVSWGEIGVTPSLVLRRPGYQDGGLDSRKLGPEPSDDEAPVPISGKRPRRRQKRLKKRHLKKRRILPSNCTVPTTTATATSRAEAFAYFGSQNATASRSSSPLNTIEASATGTPRSSTEASTAHASGPSQETDAASAPTPIQTVTVTLTTATLDVPGEARATKTVSPYTIICPLSLLIVESQAAVPPQRGPETGGEATAVYTVITPTASSAANGPALLPTVKVFHIIYLLAETTNLRFDLPGAGSVLASDVAKNYEHDQRQPVCQTMSKYPWRACLGDQDARDKAKPEQGEAVTVKLPEPVDGGPAGSGRRQAGLPLDRVDAEREGFPKPDASDDSSKRPISDGGQAGGGRRPAGLPLDMGDAEQDGSPRPTNAGLAGSGRRPAGLPLDRVDAEREGFPTPDGSADSSSRPISDGGQAGSGRRPAGLPLDKVGAEQDGSPRPTNAGLAGSGRRPDGLPLDRVDAEREGFPTPDGSADSSSRPISDGGQAGGGRRPAGLPLDMGDAEQDGSPRPTNAGLAGSGRRPDGLPLDRVDAEREGFPTPDGSADSSSRPISDGGQAGGGRRPAGLPLDMGDAEQDGSPRPTNAGLAGSGRRPAGLPLDRVDAEREGFPTPDGSADSSSRPISDGGQAGGGRRPAGLPLDMGDAEQDGSPRPAIGGLAGKGGRPGESSGATHAEHEEHFLADELPSSARTGQGRLPADEASDHSSKYAHEDKAGQRPEAIATTSSAPQVQAAGIGALALVWACVAASVL